MPGEKNATILRRFLTTARLSSGTISVFKPATRPNNKKKETTMRIDVSVLKVGDKYTRRDGQQKTVRTFEDDMRPAMRYCVDRIWMTFEGRSSIFGERPSDIVAIHPATKPTAPALNLTKAKADDKVRFRSGGRAEIEENDRHDQVPSLKFKGIGRGDDWYADGRYNPDGEDHPFDIIALEPAPEPEFDWATVTPGMAFSFSGERWFYVGPDVRGKERHVFRRESDQKFDDWLAGNRGGDGGFKRAPQHDITLPEAA